MNKFVSYKEVSQHKLKSIAQILTSLDTGIIQDHIKDDFLNYFSGEGLSREDLKFLIKKKPLESVKDAMLSVEFNVHPFASHLELYQLRGQARLMNIPNISPTTPIMYVFPNTKSTTVKHEKIHLCQYLMDSAYPLTPAQRKVFLDINLKEGIKYFLERSGQAAGVEYLTNQVCYQTWIELEANFFSLKSPFKLNLSSVEKVFDGVHASASSIDTIKSFHYHKPWGLAGSFDLDKTLSKVYKFFDETEKSVSWVKKLVKKGNYSSLREALE